MPLQEGRHITELDQSQSLGDRILRNLRAEEQQQIGGGQGFDRGPRQSDRDTPLPGASEAEAERELRRD